MDGADIVLMVRTRERLTRRAFGEQLIVSENTVYRWEARRRAVLPRHLQRIDEVFGIRERRSGIEPTPP
jgi:transcriptional regulator with XRE-family HTH domain